MQESAWEWPALFRWLKETANIEQQEMYRTFNCGVGMILVVKPEHADDAIAHLNDAGETAFLLGEIRAGAKDPQIQIV